MLLRLIACSACALMFGACERMSEAKLIGTWRCETEDAVEELSLHQDHSFWSLYSWKKGFTTPSPVEETGSWQLKGHQLLLDSIVTWSKERRQLRRTVMHISSAELVAKSDDGRATVSYGRLEEAACAPSSRQTLPLSEAALTGSWQTHYNTHDYQFRFGSGSRVSCFARDSGDWQLLLDGEWRIKDGKVLIQFERNAYGSVDREENIWTPLTISADCMAMKSGGSSRPCIMRRVH